MITEEMGLNIILAGIGSISILNFYRGKYWYIFLIIGFSLLGLRFVMDKITILTGNNEKQEFLTLKNSISYTYKNGRTESVSIGVNTLINDTEDELIIEKVEYGKYANSNNDDNFIESINPYSSQDLIYGVNYFYKDPPTSIRVKGGSSTTRYWLHK